VYRKRRSGSLVTGADRGIEQALAEKALLTDAKCVSWHLNRKVDISQ
jgi:NAD(P)-dependent dehydrogenase (short-subunit alcohol dehydrogenase family)